MTAGTIIGETEAILVGTEPTIIGTERLLAAFRVADELHVIVEQDRPSNADVLAATHVYVHDDTGITRWTSKGLRPLADHERTIFAESVTGALGDHLSLFRLCDPEPAALSEPTSAPRLVLLLDGTDRAAEAINPAIELAELCGLPLTAWAVSSDPNHWDMVNTRLAAAGLQSDRDRPVPRSTVVSQVAIQNGIGVVAAFGRWRVGAQLHGTITDQIHDGVPAAIGVGPDAGGCLASRSGPIAVAVDGSAHATEVVEALGWLAGTDRPLVVIHVDGPDSTEPSTAPAIAELIAQRYGLVVTHESVRGNHSVDALSDTVERLRSPLAIVHSSHRPQGGKSLLASVALMTVARLRCPVAITTGTGLDPWRSKARRSGSAATSPG